MTGNEFGTSQGTPQTHRVLPWTRLLSYAGILAILVLAAYLRLKGLGTEPFWMDEGYTMAYTKPPFFRMLSYIATRDVHPPLYYVFMKIWQQFGTGEAFLRLPSAIFGILAVWSLWLTVRENYGELPAAMGALLLSTSTAALWYSQEVRMYSLVILLTVLSMRWFLRFLGAMTGDISDHVPVAGRFKGHMTKEAWLLGLSTTALLYTHNVAIFFWAGQLIVGGVIFLWALRKGNPQGTGAFVRTPHGLWLAVQAAIGLAYLPWFIIFMGQSGNVGSRFWVGLPNMGTVWDTFRFALAWRAWMYPQVGGLVSLGVFAILVKALASPRDIKGLAMAMCAFFPVFASYLYSIYRAPMMVDRTLLFICVPLLGLLASFFALPARGDKGLKLVATGLKVLLGAYLTLGFAWYNYKGWDVEQKVQTKEDFRSAAAATVPYADGNTVFVINSSASQAAFDYYFSRYPEATRTEEIGMPCNYLEVPKGNANLEPLISEGDVKKLDARLQSVYRVVLIRSHYAFPDPHNLVLNYFNRNWRFMNNLSVQGVELLVYGRG